MLKEVGASRRADPGDDSPRGRTEGSTSGSVGLKLMGTWGPYGVSMQTGKRCRPQEPELHLQEIVLTCDVIGTRPSCCRPDIPLRGPPCDLWP